jgi:hypothetical protein
MSYYGKLQVLKNGTADVEIQQWAYQQLEKAKTLTDEEILKMAADRFHYSEYKLVIEFARAILRKAQNE